MMKTKTQKVFVDEGFGFPVHLLNVTMVQVRGVWTPRVNYNYLAKAVMLALATKPARWTGHEVRFVRQQLKMTLQEFADRFYVTHPAVLKWESSKDASTNMNWATEKDIRLFVYLRANGDGNLTKVYNDLRQEQPTRVRHTKIDVIQTHAAVVQNR